VKRGVDPRTSNRRTGITLAVVSAFAIVFGLIVVAAAPRPPIGETTSGANTAVHPSGLAASDSPRIAVPPASVESLIGISTPDVSRDPAFEDGRAYGAASAPATMTVWSDFQCPFCGRFARETEPLLIADYVFPGKLRIVYRDWVFIGVESVTAAVAARCAGAQGQFWPYHDYLLWNQRGENEGGFDDAHLMAFARALTLDMTAFTACTLDPAEQAAVRAETEAGDAANVGSTPTLVVDNQVMTGAPTNDAQNAALRGMIDRSIAAHQESQPRPSPS
jgi:protein-disulfide isomerase